MTMSLSCALRRMLVGLMAGSLSLTGVAVSVSPAEAAETDRLFGENRYATAAAVATATFPAGVTDVVLATGENFPDALAASGAAGYLGAPVLLTDSESLSPETQAALDTLGPDRVHIAGGVAAVGQGVEDTLDAAGYDTGRWSGRNRFETAQLIAEAIGAINVANETAIIATGENFPDALAGGPLAHSGPNPILLVTEDSVPAPTREALVNLGITEIVILGEIAAISADVEAELEVITGDAEATRLGGATRYETAVEAAQYAADMFGFDLSTVLIANGEQNLGVDALAGGPYGGVNLWPILLVTEDAVPAGTEAFLRANAGMIDTVRALGGPAVVSDVTLAAAAAEPGTN